MPERINRRSVLAAMGIGSTIVAGNALAGTGKEELPDKDEAEKAISTYDEESAIEAIEEYGKPYLRYFKEDEHDVIPTSSASLFRTGELLTIDEFHNGSPGIFVNAVNFDGEGWTPRITARYENEKYFVKIYIKPGVKEAHSVVEKKYMEDVKVLHTFSDGSVDTTTGDGVIGQEDLNGGAGDCDCCYIGDYCTGSTSYSCWGIFDEYEIYECEDGSCYTGDHTGCCGDSKYNDCEYR